MNNILRNITVNNGKYFTAKMIIKSSRNYNAVCGLYSLGSVCETVCRNRIRWNLDG